MRSARSRAASNSLIVAGRSYYTFYVSVKNRGLCPHVKNRRLRRRMFIQLGYVIGPDLSATPAPVEKFAAVDVTSVFIGGCSTGRIEDIRKVVSVINGRKINRKIRTTVAFASTDVYIQAANEGLISALMDAGALVMNQGCSGCCAHSQALVDSKDVVLSAGSRICPNCNGEGDVPTYICSAATAMESAIRGFICHFKV